MPKTGVVARTTARTTAPARAHDMGKARVIGARQGEVATSFWRRHLDWLGCSKS